jgi:hypothetical protein
MMFVILFGGRRQRNGVRVGNDFGTLFAEMIPTNSVTILNPDPQHGMGLLIPNRSVEIHRVVSFPYQEPPIKEGGKTCEIYRS